MVPTSRYAADALRLMAATIRSARIERHMSQDELATRAGISRALLIRIERGEAGCGIGSVFEVAAILGVPLFGLDATGLTRAVARTTDRLSLLPGAVHRARGGVSDDF